MTKLQNCAVREELKPSIRLRVDEGRAADSCSVEYIDTSDGYGVTVCSCMDGAVSSVPEAR